MRDHKEVLALFRENHRLAELLLLNLVDGLGPTHAHDHRWEDKGHLPQANWLLDPDNAHFLREVLHGLALERPARHIPYFAPFQVTYYDGNPPHSTLLARRLLDRLQHGLAMVSHNNQEGLMGTTYDEQDVARRIQEIRLVVEDIAYALLGEKARELVNFELPPFGDVTYHREVPPCIEADVTYHREVPPCIEAEGPEAARQWHAWAANIVAEYCDGFTEEMEKCSDDELKASIERLLADLMQQAYPDTPPDPESDTPPDPESIVRGWVGPIARGFKRVRYSYHRDLFKLLGYPDIAAQFDAIWALCEPHMETDPHEPQVLGQEPAHWLPYIDNPTFYTALIEVLESEAAVDEEKGRTRLASMLRAAVRLIKTRGKRT